jgi:biotin synthase-like enzyme
MLSMMSEAHNEALKSVRDVLARKTFQTQENEQLTSLEIKEMLKPKTYELNSDCIFCKYSWSIHESNKTN